MLGLKCSWNIELGRWIYTARIQGLCKVGGPCATANGNQGLSICGNPQYKDRGTQT